ncbi:MAG: hypothetical protein K6C95_01260, partial [Lachnospiraceae bacterium]|nr:hypothetical protein [Lachnospiraceae bacterium]
MDSNAVERIRYIVFYLMLGMELVVMMVEKSSAYAPYDSYLFRVCFVLALAAVVMSSYSLKQWILIAAVILLTFVHYRLTDSNDLLRYAMFIFACKDHEPGKVIKFCFFTSLAGFCMIALLSCAGILGEISMTADYGRSVGIETRYVFGFGHPNTLHGSFYSLLLMALFLWEERTRGYSEDGVKKKNNRADIAFFVLCFLANLLLFAVTRSRTAAIIGAVTVVCMGLLHYADSSDQRVRRTVCAAGLISIAADIGFSVWSAAVSRLTSDRNGFIFKLSRLLN